MLCKLFIIEKQECSKAHLCHLPNIHRECDGHTDNNEVAPCVSLHAQVSQKVQTSKATVLIDHWMFFYFSLLVSMAPLSYEIQPVSSCTPQHIGPAIPEVSWTLA